MNRRQTDDPTGLGTALSAEYAAVYAYGAIGARLSGADASAARAAEEAHRSRRDELLLTLTARGVVPPAAASSYQLPFPVTDPQQARRLAVLIEDRVAAVWHAVLPQVPAEDRQRALDALVDAAVRATEWRLAAGEDPPTVPFPGATA